MEWWIIAALVAGLLLLGKMYRISVRENRELTNFALLSLLDDYARTRQREALIDLVRVTDAKNAGELGSKVFVGAATQLAAPLAKTWTTTYGLLWKLKSG
jgi:hypothetical protein